MAFKVVRTIYTLAFEDPDYAGMEVKTKSLSVGEMIKASALMALSDDSLPAEQKLAHMGEAFDLFSKALLSWNLEEEDGTPVPCTRDGMDTLEMPMISGLITAWVKAAAGASDPLNNDSTSGQPSLVESIPTEALSPSLAS